MVRYFYRRVIAEIVLTWNLIVSNIGATIIPGVLFTIASMTYHRISFFTASGFWIVFMSTIIFSLYISTFDLTNQIAGIVEDRTNGLFVSHKKNRPLATGLMGIKGAWIRLGMLILLYCYLSSKWGILLWTLLWIATFIIHDLFGGSKFWVSKDLTMSSGVLMQLASAWELAGPITAIAVKWILFQAIINWWLVNIQDLRDVKGDSIVGRKTFPIIYGLDRTRKIFAFSFFAAAILTHFIMYAPLGNGWHILLASAWTNGTLCLVGVRLLMKKYHTEQGDHRSYQIYIYWYCFALASAILVM